MVKRRVRERVIFQPSRKPTLLIHFRVVQFNLLDYFKGLSHGCFQLLKFINETIVGEVIIDKMNQTHIYFYVIKFTILIGQSTNCMG